MSKKIDFPRISSKIIDQIHIFFPGFHSILKFVGVFFSSFVQKFFRIGQPVLLILSKNVEKKLPDRQPSFVYLVVDRRLRWQHWAFPGGPFHSLYVSSRPKRDIFF